MDHEVACDILVYNQGFMDIAKSDSLNEPTKHIYVTFYIVKDKVKECTIIIQYVPSAAMEGDIFMKVIEREKHILNQRMLGIRCPK